MSTFNRPSEQAPPVVRINEVDYVTARDAAKYLGVIYGTVMNRLNSRQQYLKGTKIGATVFITVDSLEAERARMTASKEVAA